MKHSIANCLVDIGVVPEYSSEAANAVFEGCSSLDEEFKIIKRSYFQKVLQDHPDKGGDAAQFRQTQTAFEVLRELYQKGKVKQGGFASYFGKKKSRGRKQPSEDDEAEDWDDIFQSFASSTVPSYEHFAGAAEEEVPGYCVELARSGRSQCTKCKLTNKKEKAKAATTKDSVSDIVDVDDDGGKKTKRGRTKKDSTAAATTTTLSKAVVPTTAPPRFISKGGIRVGSLDDKSGSYGRWHHLSCWRVPSRVWSGLTQPDQAEIVLGDLLRMDEVLLTGLTSLTDDRQAVFVDHVMDRSHWAKKYKTKKKLHETASNPAATSMPNKRGTDEPASHAASHKRPKTNEGHEKGVGGDAPTALVASKERFAIPRPGVNGALGEGELEGKRFVMTGVFPEVGGGAGLNMGKDKVRKMIEDFGGKVTGSVSGKTDYLVVGKAPGATKVSQARERGLPMIDLRTLQSILLGQTSFLEANEKAPPKIESFSAGYPGRMIGY